MQKDKIRRTGVGKTGGGVRGDLSVALVDSLGNSPVVLRN